MTERVGRDDGLLYSGATSASFAKPKVQELVQEKREEAKRKRQELNPAGKIVNDEIQKAINALSVTDHAAVKALIASGIPHALETDMLAKAISVDQLKVVQTRLNNILRDNKL